ncbi:MAG: exonuclease domain-containing protein [Melioribacteraceae bacterium]|nr:exonuclease domain-containing protein [Melioribacteraceae bacterium]
MNKTVNKQEVQISELTIEEAQFAVLDFETTGTSSKFARAIEVGIAKVKNGKVIDTYSSLINPGSQIPYQITLLTGITNEDVLNAPYFEDIVDEIENFIGDSILVAHNLQFDLSFLRSEFLRAGKDVKEIPKVCTLKIARKLYPSLPSKSLGNLVKYLRVKHVHVHRALGDALATAKILDKMIRVLQDEYHVEEVSHLINFSNLPQQKSYKLIKKKLSDDFSSLPDTPGVYFFKNAKDEIIYVGKAKSLKDRVRNYFSSTAIRKAKKIVNGASRISHQKTNTELVALITESELIKKYNPKLNTQLKKYGQSYFLKVDKNKPAPKILSTSTFDFDGNDYFGPFSSRDSSKAIIEIIDKSFMLRECTDKEFKKSKRCYLADIERCTAPCEKNGIKDLYKNELEKVYSFLSGKNDSALERLIIRMKNFSEKEKFEEAAEVRDTINLLLAQIKKVAILAEPINSAKVFIEVSDSGGKDYILLVEGRLYIKDYGLDNPSLFETVLDDYFDGTINLISKSEERDLDRIKILLSWMSNHMENTRVFYLKNFKSKEELYIILNG